MEAVGEDVEVEAVEEVIKFRRCVSSLHKVINDLTIRKFQIHNIPWEIISTVSV